MSPIPVHNHFFSFEDTELGIVSIATFPMSSLMAGKAMKTHELQVLKNIHTHNFTPTHPGKNPRWDPIHTWVSTYFNVPPSSTTVQSICTS